MIKLKEVETSEYSFNPIHDYIPDRFLMTAGEQLQKDIGLEKFRFVYIQKVMGYALPIYIITYNSKYPTVALPLSILKKLKFTWFATAKRKAIHTFAKPLKLTPL